MATQARLGVANQKLVAAIRLMEDTADEPRDVRQIAAEVGLSPRQLERLFAKYLHANPRRHYLELRLDKARELLLQTSKPILDVAVACGFASASHFSRCYRSAYGHKPSDERAAALGGGGDHKHDRPETAGPRSPGHRGPRLALR
jgi:transcriptional regulator GlxA family with amidase domain